MCGIECSHQHPYSKHNRRVNGLVSHGAPVFPLPNFFFPMAFILSFTPLFTYSFHLPSATYPKLSFLRDRLVHFCVSRS